MTRSDRTTTRVIRWRAGWPALALFLPLLLIAGAALAQDSGGAAGATAGEPAGRSFASAFFVSVRADGRLEILGCLIIWFLLLLSLVSIGLIGMMAATNQRKSIAPPGVLEEVKALLDAGKFKEALELTGRDESFFSRIMNAALRDSPHGFASLTRTLEQTADELTTARLRRIEYLNVLGQVSPMIGLFGTVYGMILAFQAIVVSGGNADPILLASGIGTALTTTFWGLVVAIPALAGYAIIRNQIDELTMDATLRAEEMLNQFRPRPAAAAAQQAVAAAAPKKPTPRPAPKA